MKKKLVYSLLAACLAVTMVVAGCGGGKTKTDDKKIINPGDPIKVCSMNDTEGEILGHMIALALENAGYEVKDNTGTMSGTANGRKALLEDETDIYVEYTGRGLRLIEGVDRDLYRYLESAYQSVSTWDAANNNLIWTAYAPFNNTDGLAVSSKFAKENNVYSMADLARFINEGGVAKLVCEAYFVSLASGLPGMEATYGFHIDENNIITGPSNREQMIYEETDGCNIAHLYTSSALIKAYDLVVLDAPEHVCPVYSPCPVVRKVVIDKYPGIRDALDPVFKSISLEEQQDMNWQVQVEGKSGLEVAREYLTKNGFIK